MDAEELDYNNKVCPHCDTSIDMLEAFGVVLPDAAHWPTQEYDPDEIWIESSSTDDNEITAALRESSRSLKRPRADKKDYDKRPRKKSTGDFPEKKYR